MRMYHLKIHWDDEKGDIKISDLLKQKYSDYIKLSRWYKFLYYFTRIIGGLSAAVLPFLIKPFPFVASFFSILIVILTALDIIFSSKDHWILYEEAINLLTIAKLKLSKNYIKYKDIIEILLGVESKRFKLLSDMVNIIKDIKE